MKTNLFLFFIITMVMMLGVVDASAESKNVTMQVGETQTFYLPSSITSKRLKSVTFYSNGISYVQVVSYTNYSVKVKAIKAYSSPVIVRCDYYYYVSSGSYTYQAKGYYDYNITVVGETKAKPTKITLPSVVAVEVGESKDLVPTVTPANAEYTLTWKVTNSSIATVYQNGMITGKTVGETDLKVSADNGVYTMCRIVVYKPSASSVSMKSALSLDVGESTYLTPSVYPSNADYSLSWTSSDEDVATVTSAGRVNAVGAGTAKITVQTNNGKSATCMVTVNQPLDKLTFTLGESGRESYKAYVTNYAADFASSGNVQAFIVVQTGEDYVQLEEVYEAPKGTPILLRGVQGESVTIQMVDNVSWNYDNLLMKTTSNTTVTQGDDIFVPAYHEAKWGFYRFEGTLPSGKIYLNLGGTNVKTCQLLFQSDCVTSIRKITEGEEAPAGARMVYNLSGRATPLNKMQKGIYIVNGKKYFVK